MLNFICKPKLLRTAGVVFLACHALYGNAQIKLPKLKDVDKSLRDFTKVLHSSIALMNATARTTQEFNKTVTIVRGDRVKKDLRDGEITKPVIKKGEFVTFKWEPVAYFDNHLFPSTIIGMATYKGEFSKELEAISRPLGFRIVSEYSGIPIDWEIECVEKKYFDKVRGSFLYEEGGKEVYLMPDIPWNFEALRQQLGSTPLNVYFRLFDQQGKKVERVIPVFLRSINDCIFRYKSTSLDFLFAAYIQEEHPEIDFILKEALNTKIVGSIAGYQHRNEDSVHAQVQAIWKVLHDRGFQYSSITPTAGTSKHIYSQAVRSFDNALKTSQANCVDGTIVFASILRKIGIHTKLALTSNHCFLGYYTGEDRKSIAYLETVLLSDSRFIDTASTALARKEAYTKQFLLARYSGMATYEKYKAADDFLLVDVELARRLVKPIPF